MRMRDKNLIKTDGDGRSLVYERSSGIVEEDTVGTGTVLDSRWTRSSEERGSDGAGQKW